jgi:hypothetical protein
MEFRHKKRAQVTIFIILAIIIVIGVSAYFLLFYNGVNVSKTIKSDPAQYIHDCAKDNANLFLDNVLAHGGVFYNELSDWEFLSFNNTKVLLLCYTNETKKNCINRHPLLELEIEKKLTSFLKPKIETCFSEVIDALKPGVVSEGSMNFSLDVIKGKILFYIEKPITIASGEESTSFRRFDTEVSSNIYELLDVQNMIITREVSCDCQDNNCNADLGKINLDYPQLITARFMTEKHEKIYTLTSSLNKNKFSFAVRNCVNG